MKKIQYIINAIQFVLYLIMGGWIIFGCLVSAFIEVTFFYDLLLKIGGMKSYGIIMASLILALYLCDFISNMIDRKYSK